jgi:RNA 2',3'-cyclic 3'-phosphodiesterase
VSDERARLFVALELPREVRDALVAWRAAAVGTGDGLRFVRAADLHVTLCFLGWREWAQADAIAEACAAARGTGGIALGLGEPAALPRRRPRVLAVSLEDPDGGLSALQARLSAALAAGGWYQPESRPFFAHVTVARAGRGARIPRGALVAASVPELRFTGSGVVLFRSRLSRAGARYEAVSSVRLESG